MIFLTTGTQLSFDRLVRAVDDWAESARPSCDIFGQVLPPPDAPYIPRNFQTRARLSPAEYADMFGKASLVISHAGMGTILTALTQGQRICIMPRQARYGEHRNDHQLATARRLKAHPCLFKARDEADLPRCLDAALRPGAERDRGQDMPAIDPFASADLTDRLRDFILAPGK